MEIVEQFLKLIKSFVLWTNSKLFESFTDDSQYLWIKANFLKIDKKKQQKMFQKIKVPTECRQMFKLMNLCVKSNLRVFGFKIPHFVIFTLLSIPLRYSVVLHIWKAIKITSKLDASEFGSNLKELAIILLMIVGTT